MKLFNNYFDQLATAIPLLMGEHGIPGFAISVVDREGSIFSGAYGYTDTAKRTPVTSETVFSIQSISKTYTAFGFMLAVAAGKVSLDDPLKRIVPAFTVKHKDGNDYSGLITFRHLLSHRSGLGHEAPIGNNFGYGPFTEHIASIYETYLRFKPNETYSYSNLGIDLVAYALQEIMDMPFESYMQQSVFTPLNMSRSTYNQQQFLLNNDSAMGHDQQALAKFPVSMLGAGGMYACADDMAQFVMCFLNGGFYEGQQLIDNVILRKMYTEYSASEEWRYQLGLGAELQQRRLLLNHNGGGFGFLGTQDILPEVELGAVALTNSVNHPAIQLLVCRNMWRDLLEMKDAGIVDCERLDDHLERYIGLYEAQYNGGSHRLAVFPRNGGLFCKGQRLVYHSSGLFFTGENDCVEFTDDAMRFNYVLYQKIE
ncbi:serine hydrolase domain-containing protein [Paenibacillus tengchongensis]|uniref:serine hydrolase domain-containing protein n=1 Tax=Paenibacillus tengchongensis TaxID=2608684 RepID=UPI00124C860F|nr:serine hydrolase domain-containing protein [Paenibacillus tengchongensis]